MAQLVGWLTMAIHAEFAICWITWVAQLVGRLRHIFGALKKIQPDNSSYDRRVLACLMNSGSGFDRFQYWLKWFLSVAKNPPVLNDCWKIPHECRLFIDNCPSDKKIPWWFASIDATMIFPKPPLRSGISLCSHVIHVKSTKVWTKHQIDQIDNRSNRESSNT